MSALSPFCSVVVPVFRSEDTLSTLVMRLIDVFEQSEFEIILVDDGSRDGSWEQMQELQRQHSSIIMAVQLTRNYGQHNAIMCGLRLARGQVIVTIDDDLQNPPEEIPNLIEALQQRRLDVVYGVPSKKNHHALRNVGSLLVNAFYRIVFGSSVTVTSFRGIRRDIVLSILPYDLNFTYVDGLLAWNTSRIGEVKVEHHPRSVGRSGYSVGKLITLALNLFTNFSLLPLQLVTATGLVAAGIGLVTGIYYLVQHFRAQIAVPGYASIIVAVLVLGGIQLLALGMIGEYLGRVHLNINRKPQYAIRQIIGRAIHSEYSENDDPIGTMQTVQSTNTSLFNPSPSRADEKRTEPNYPQ